MSRHAQRIALSDEVKQQIQARASAPSTPQGQALRLRIILRAAEGKTNEQISQELDVCVPAVRKWRGRFAQAGLESLSDKPRSGKPTKYDHTFRQRVLAALEETPPAGQSTWDGPSLAAHLQVSDDAVWRLLRREGICLQRQRSWCISTDPEFTPKAADIVGLYLAPPENGIVLSVDEKPHIKALERAQGYLRLPNGAALRGFGHEYTRHGTSTLFAALNVGTGQLKAGHFARRRRREFLAFMNEVVADYPDRELHIVLDNLNTHKPKVDRWLARHPRVHFHFTPTHASWLNQIECWFSILSRRALNAASFTSVQKLREAIDRFIDAYNRTAAPFEWRKRVVHAVPLKHSYADLCS